MIINGTNYPHIRQGNGFKDTLLAPLELKPFITNESRLENGTRTLVETPKKSSRNLILEFKIVGSSKMDTEGKLAQLYQEFYKGTFELSGLEFTSQTFHLVYTGRSPVYHSGVSMCAVKVSAGFIEPNPHNR